MTFEETQRAAVKGNSNSMKSPSEMRKPLSHIQVLDLTHAVMGPCASLMLADLGADVVHVEPPDGDPTRSLKGFGMGYFPFYNRNKRSLAVDLKSEQGLAVVRRLAKECDVFIENFFGFNAHFPFFFGEAVIHERINLWNYIESNSFAEFLWWQKLVFVDFLG